jgi:DNA-binding protein HU-beta
MNKKELIKAVVEATGFPKKDVTTVVDTVFDKIAEALKDGKTVNIHGHGKYEVRERAARKGRNPQSGEEIMIEARKVPAFKPAKQLKNLVK